MLRKYYPDLKFKLSFDRIKVNGIFPKTLQNFFTYLIDQQGISWYNVIVPRGNKKKENLKTRREEKR